MVYLRSNSFTEANKMLDKAAPTAVGKSNYTRTYLSIALNFLIFIFASLGVILACVLAEQDGYSPWYKRLLYFTQLSNVWIGTTCGAFAVLAIVGLFKNTTPVRNVFYVLKYIFTVSITVTGIIFCSLLAPFADYNVWIFSSVLTHVVVPVLSITELFICDAGEGSLRLRHTFCALIPPSAYFIFTSILCILKVDFGKGEPYPYFFMNFYSDVGMFGADFSGLPQLGAFYWMVFLISLIFGLSLGYYKLYLAIGRKRRPAAIRSQERNNIPL